MKRGGPLPRHAALKRGGSLARRTPLKARNPKRLASAWSKAYGSSEYLAFVHAQPCVVPGCEETRIHAAHVRSRGAGGTWRSVVSMCRDHHREQHEFGILTFQRKYAIDLPALAAAFAEQGASLVTDA